jgi:thiamine pyrophosphate-dependent acetolactate synthase large subunit-like protein
VPGVQVADTDALAQALRNGFASRGPVVIEALL